MNESNRQFQKLAPEGQAEVTELRNVIFYRWPTPNVPAEAKLDWDDDLAVLYMDYGRNVLDEAIRFHRMNSERRPSIPAIKAHCASIREHQGVRRSKADYEMLNHERAVAKHLEDPNDDDFVPFALLARDAMELAALKRQCVLRGIPINPAEVQSWLGYRAEKTRMEWRELRAQGVCGFKFVDEKRGPGEMGGLDAAARNLTAGVQMRLDRATQGA